VAHDPVASFYGGYDQVGLVRARPHRIPRVAVLLAIAVLVLVVFVAADVAAYESLPVTVHMTSVSWISEGTVLATQAGFSLRAGAHATLTLSCDSVCIKFGGASVNSPFALLAFSVVYHPDQYTNVTVAAPASAYSGPLSITLSVNPEAPTGDTPR
jgi:hypothetical protein